jgi:hypothetical protein
MACGSCATVATPRSSDARFASTVFSPPSSASWGRT